MTSFSQSMDSAQKADVIHRINQLKESYKLDQVIDSCDKYLLDEECGSFREKLFTLKTQCLYRIGYVPYRFEKRFSGDPKVYLKIADSTTKLIDSLIANENLICGSKLEDYNRMRYEYYGGFDIIKPELYNGKNKVHKVKGTLFGLSPQYFYGNNQWVGFEIYTGFFQRKTKMKYIRSSSMYSFDYLRIGYRQNISGGKGSGMNINLYSVSNNWINIRAINFSYLDNDDNFSWGYAPEIGFQFWYLHLNAGYNLAFKKSMRSYEKLYFTAKFDIPIYSP